MQFPSEGATRCVMCSTAFPGYGARGVCPSCQKRYRAFVPKKQMGPDTVTPGYVSRSTGMIRYDRSDTARMQGDAPPFRLRYDPKQVFGKIPRNPKRTPQQRIDSLHQRIAETIARFGTIPDSILRDVQREQIAQGKAPMTGEQLRQLAGFYLSRSENEEEGRQRKLIVRTA